MLKFQTILNHSQSQIKNKIPTNIKIFTIGYKNANDTKASVLKALSNFCSFVVSSSLLLNVDNFPPDIKERLS